MKNKRPELDVDFIGGSRTLTPEEEKKISEIIRASKLKRERSLARKKKKNCFEKKDFKIMEVKGYDWVKQEAALNA